MTNESAQKSNFFSEQLWNFLAGKSDTCCKIVFANCWDTFFKPTLKKRDWCMIFVFFKCCSYRWARFDIFRQGIIKKLEHSHVAYFLEALQPRHHRNMHQRLGYQVLQTQNEPSENWLDYTLHFLYILNHVCTSKGTEITCIFDSTTMNAVRIH